MPFTQLIFLFYLKFYNQMKKQDFTEKNWEQVSNLFLKNSILIVTATDVESYYLHDTLKPLTGEEKIIRIFEGDLTYFLGILGNYNVVHVQSAMGSISRDSSINTVATALGKTKTKIVIMVGIAFGTDATKQNIGDVLLAESVIPYNSKRVGKDITIQRGIEAPSSKVLFNRFKNIANTWEFILSNNDKAKLIPCRMLSGEDLIDNLEYRDNLIRNFPDAKGGEMEGAGIYAACDSKAEWIIVKGICDFADGEKGKDKNSRQIQAIKAALSICLELFSSNEVFRALDVSPIIENNGTPTFQGLNLNNLLFDVYTRTKEAYYIQRNIDNHFSNTVNQFGVWVYGPVGCGKSTLILRNLLYHDKKFIQICLASCSGLASNDFFKEILFELASNISGLKKQYQPQNFQECVKAIIEILSSNFLNKEFIIYIEELPISTEEEYKDFSNKLFSLLISKNQITGLENIFFVLSSLNGPQKYIQTFQQKIHEQIQFISLPYWENIEIVALVDKIESELQYSLINEKKMELIKIANGSPRFIKKFYRSLISYNKYDDSGIQYILNETKRELN